MIDKYNYNDEPSGRVDTLAMALDKCERLEKQLDKAIEGLELIANYGVSAWDIANAKWCLKQIKELEK